MANRFFTFMVIPERSAKVRKWVVPVHLIRWGFIVLASLAFLGVVTSFMTLRYLAREGEFRQAILKNQYLEGQLQGLEDKISTADSTLVRIQNFEQKLRVLGHLDSAPSSGGIGPISKEEEEQMLAETDPGDRSKWLAAADAGSSGYKSRIRSLELSADDLHSRATLQEQSLQELYELLKDQESLLSSTPSIWPAQGWVTSRFGYRVSPFTGSRQLHEGLDIAAPSGTRVLAPADGVVTQVITEAGYGKVVVINHGYGLVTRFGHNSEVLVKTGARVQRGEAIAKIGSTGRSTGPHVHYEVRVNGIPVNPSRYILN